jgi:hypothetical protein
MDKTATNQISERIKTSKSLFSRWNRGIAGKKSQEVFIRIKALYFQTTTQDSQAGSGIS